MTATATLERPSNDSITPQKKFHITRAELSCFLMERESEIDLVLTALLSNEHVLLIGPPGTGKSMTADAVVQWMVCRKFSYLLNKTTDPNEIVGPVDVAGLKTGDYRRITVGKLPEAEIAFLDEAFKCNSAGLNLMLGILNERQFRNGLSMMKCPLRTAIAASNEFPTEAKELGALFDRFLFRKMVHPVGDESSIERLMYDKDLDIKLTTTLSIDELDQAQDEAHNVEWSTDAKEAAAEIRHAVTREGIIIGDRRLRKSAVACQAYAWLNGNDEVTTDDLEILAHIWWVSPESQPHFVADQVARVARPLGLLAAQYLGEAKQIVSKVDLKDLSAASAAANKLADVVKKLKKLEQSERVKMTYERVEKMRKDLRTRAMEAI